jgi:RHS repeat-associated protein
VSAKRYRYIGCERDEETGLYLMGARYYAAWLGRWTAADPAGTVDGTNLYAYVRGSPVGLRDPSGTLTEAEQQAFDAAVARVDVLIAETKAKAARVDAIAAETKAKSAKIVSDATAATWHGAKVNKSAFAASAQANVHAGQGPSEAEAEETSTAVAVGKAQAVGWSSAGQTALIASPAGAMALGAYKLYGAYKEWKRSEDVGETALKATAGVTKKEAKETIEAVEQGDPQTISFLATSFMLAVGSAAVIGALGAGGGKHPWSPTYREAPADSHHIIQDAAARSGPQVSGRPAYSRSRAPATTLAGPSTKVGSPHYRATRVQEQAGGGTYGAERRIGYKALRKAGQSPAEARANVERADRYFIDELRWTKATPLNIPGNR